jgi:ankyrin repeat protein
MSEEEGDDFDRSVPFVIADDIDPESPVVRLLDAVGHADLATARSILGRHPELLDRPGPVCVAASLGDMERDEMCPLRYATRHGRTPIVEMLLKAGANARVVDEYGSTPMHDAAMRGHVRIIRLLAEHGADIDSGNCRGRTPLLVAASNDQVPCAHELLKLGADVRRGDTENGNGIMHEVRDAELAGILLDAGASRDQPAKDGDTPLHAAVINGFVDVAVLVIERGAPLDVTNEEGKTPLDLVRESDDLSREDRARLERAMRRR